MRTLLLIGTLAAVGLVWAFNRMTTTDLRSQIEQARQENDEVASLQRERERLQRLLRDAEERAQRDRVAADLARAQQELADRQTPAHRPPPSTLTSGEWLPTGAWKNRGHHTPTATVETALWAAAGGDVAALKDMLQLDESVRAKAAAILARLPESSRALYASPEHLIAAFTTKSIPLGAAQLVWQHESGPDEAVACVFVKNPEDLITSQSEIARSQGSSGKTPPMAPPNNRAVSAYLSLRRTDAGWRLVVPLSAVESIAKELGGSK